MLISSVKLMAQRTSFAATYTVGFGIGDLNEYISKPSFRGATLEFRSMVDDGIGVGAEVGWSAFYEEPGYVTAYDGTQALSGTQYRYCSTVPILADLNYYLKPDEKINPFVGIGIGTEYSRTDLDIGQFRFRDETWHFLIKPELGIIAEVSPGTGIILSAKYYNAFKTEDLGESRSYIAANLGFIWYY